MPTCISFIVSVIEMEGCCDEVPAVTYLYSMVNIYPSQEYRTFTTYQPQKRGHILFYPQEHPKAQTNKKEPLLNLSMSVLGTSVFFRGSRFLQKGRSTSSTAMKIFARYILKIVMHSVNSSSGSAEKLILCFVENVFTISWSTNKNRREEKFSCRKSWSMLTA
jgi:hypothetical protein